MGHEDDYTFVTIDSEAVLDTDAVVVDVSADGGFLDAVMIDDMTADAGDFITLADDTVMLDDQDMTADYVMDMSDMDISFVL